MMVTMAEQPQQAQHRYVDTGSTSDERTRAMLAHLMGMLGLLDMFIFGLIGSFVVYLTGRGESGYVEDHAREAVNFQISLLIYTIIAGVLFVMTFGLAIIILIPLAIGMWFLRLIAGIIACIAASKGEYYRYPLCIRLVR